MYRPWQSLFGRQCRVIRIGDDHILPIFKNATASMDPGHRTRKRVIDHDITDLDKVIVFLREPESRFKSGVNTVAEELGIATSELVNKIMTETYSDWHYVPQFVWLCHLYKYFKNDVEFRGMDRVKEYTNLHSVNYHRQDPVMVLEKFVHVDKLLMQRYMNKTARLGDVIKDLYNELPKD